jgi:hypothetical protein
MSSTLLKTIKSEFMAALPVPVPLTGAVESKKPGVIGDIENIVFILPNNNCIFFDYPAFKDKSKLLAESTMNRIFELIDETITTHSNFELHINMRLFTITSLEQNMKHVQNFYERFGQDDKNYVSKLTKLHVYYTPNVMNQIVKILSKFNIDNSIGKKSIFHTKGESEALLHGLLNT